MVEEKMVKIDDAYEKSGLPEAPDIQIGEKLLVRMREAFYRGDGK